MRDSPFVKFCSKIIADTILLLPTTSGMVWLEYVLPPEEPEEEEVSAMRVAAFAKIFVIRELCRSTRLLSFRATFDLSRRLLRFSDGSWTKCNYGAVFGANGLFYITVHLCGIFTRTRTTVSTRTKVFKSILFTDLNAGFRNYNNEVLYKILFTLGIRIKNAFVSQVLFSGARKWPILFRPTFGVVGYV